MRTPPTCLPILLLGLAVALLSGGCSEASKFVPDAGVYAAPDARTPVVPAEAVPVSQWIEAGGRRLAPGEGFSVAPGESIQLAAKVEWSDGSVTEPGGFDVWWSAADASVLSVTPNGLATGVRAGQTTVYASANGQLVPITATVTEAFARLLSVDKTSLTLTVGETAMVAVTASMSDGSSRDVTSLALYQVSVLGIVEASGGTIRARSAGTSTVTIGFGVASTSLAVTVREVALDSLILQPGNASLNIGESVSFRVQGVYRDGSTRDLTSAAAWTVSNSAVGRIDAGGVFHASSPGLAMVTATAGGALTTATLEVRNPRVVSLAIAPANSTVVKADEAQFTATATYSNGQTGSVTGSATWSVGDTEVGSIDERGMFTAIKTGATEVRASFGGQSTYTVVTVTAPSVVSISVSPANASVTLGGTTSLVAYGRLSNGTSRDITSACQWTSFAPSVASISRGVVTGVALGSTTVTCTLEGRSASATVTVEGGCASAGPSVQVLQNPTPLSKAPHPITPVFAIITDFTSYTGPFPYNTGTFKVSKSGKYTFTLSSPAMSNGFYLLRGVFAPSTGTPDTPLSQFIIFSQQLTNTVISDVALVAGEQYSYVWIFSTAAPNVVTFTGVATSPLDGAVCFDRHPEAVP